MSVMFDFGPSTALGLRERQCNQQRKSTAGMLKKNKKKERDRKRPKPKPSSIMRAFLAPSTKTLFKAAAERPFVTLPLILSSLGRILHSKKVLKLGFAC